MDGQLAISVDKLEQMFARVVEHMKEVENRSIVLNQDYFWSVPYPEIYNVYERPSELTIGQLSESWERLESTLIDADSEPVNYHLVWLGDILRAIGNRA